MKLIIGLGNPEKKYERTRHNVGFQTIDALAEKFQFPKFKLEKKFQGLISYGEINGEKTILLKPQTWMNRSGESVEAVSHFYKIPSEDIVLFFDDADLEFGTVRFREKGRSGGHNGIKSIIQAIGENFPRIKIGIANDKRRTLPAEDFVLQKFTPPEEKQLPDILDQAIEKLLEEFY